MQSVVPVHICDNLPNRDRVSDLGCVFHTRHEHNFPDWSSNHAGIVRSAAALNVIEQTVLQAFEPKMASWTDTSELFMSLRYLVHSSS